MKAPQQDNQTPNREELLQMAIRTAKAGNGPAAKVMFRQVLSDDKRNERAMMWMAKLSDDKTERKQWLTKVIEVNPGNDIARTSLRKMEYRRSASDNRTLLIFGVVAGIMIVLALVLFVGLFVLPG
ncbi:MAG: hypothetical protein SF162_12925 [bacterium]|nr:hypothetical protein [bacterium]